MIIVILYQTGSSGSGRMELQILTVDADLTTIGVAWPSTVDRFMRVLVVLAICFASILIANSCCAQLIAMEDLPSVSPPELESLAAIEVEPLITGDVVNATDRCGPCQADNGQTYNDIDFSWLDSVKVGYDKGFVIASQREQNLGVSSYPFQMKLNGWGQLRHTYLDSQGPNRNLNQFQLKRGRLAFTTTAFDRNFSTFVQLDGRSSSGDDIRMLDYSLSWDVGHAQLGLEPGTFGFRTGKYKMPFTMSRWLSGRDFEFADRSMASTYFDVNRSFGWGLHGQFNRKRMPIFWETAIFNGLVTGGAETGSSGTLDDNFAASARAHCFPVGEWGQGALADFQWHQGLAMRFGCGFATSEIDRSGATEFSRIRVVDSGNQLSNLLDRLPTVVNSYSVSLFAIDASAKYRGWSTTLEYYFRTVDDFKGAPVADLFDDGFWLQLGYFVIPQELQLIGRWSRVRGNSGTLGATNQSAEEISLGFARYFKLNHAKLVADVTHLDGAPINSSALDISPGEKGWLWRTQIQFSF